MSDAELDREDGIDHLDDDNAHQSCYVFQPLIHDDIDQEQPVKKRRKTKSLPSEPSSAFPLLNNGKEPTELAQLRYETFREIWNKKQSRIEKIIEKADEAALTRITDFVKKPLRKHPDSKLHAGLIVSGPDGGAQTRLLERWQAENSEIVIHLRASHCSNLQVTLKNIIKHAISTYSSTDGYQNFLNKHKKLIPMPYDLELLQIFVEENHIQRIVLSILDVETFDIGIISELFAALASWSQTIPFAALLGIATTVELFESRISRSTVSLLDATTFALQSSDGLLEQILEDVQKDEDQVVRFGPATISALEELKQSQGITIDAFVSAIKYAIMSHFFANSLSVLSSSKSGLDSDVSLCTSIRNTSSFQEYCSALLSTSRASSRKEVSDLLTNDETLLRASIKAAKLVSQHLPAQNYSLTEAYVINSRQLFHPFTPRPRFALERALGRPVDYLGCECCQPNNAASASSSAPPTTTLYTLFQEAGTVINLRDLYDAFCARSFPPLDTADDDQEVNGDKADRKQLSVFYTALAELKMLGLVKSSTSAVIKKRALATSGLEKPDASIVTKGRDKYGDVDFVAKTGWIGL